MLILVKLLLNGLVEDYFRCKIHFMVTHISQIKKEATEFMLANKLGVLATVTEEKSPECATMHIFFDEKDWSIYFVTRPKTRKYENLMKNKNIALVVGTEMGHRTLQIEGVAEVLDDKDSYSFVDRSNVHEAIEYMYSSNKDPFFKTEGLEFKVFKIHVSWARFMYFDPKLKKEVFEQVVP